MRTIKYRLWDSENHKYWEPDYRAYEGVIDDLTISGVGQLIRRGITPSPRPLPMDQDQYILEQFTGLQDKNGVDIYEGDIIKGQYIGGIVKYFDDYGIFGTVDKRFPNSNKPKGRSGSSTSYEPYIIKPFYHNRIEVIGNIHENEDLLND